MRRTLAGLIFMLLALPLPRAMAEGAGACYPPPCRLEAPAPANAAGGAGVPASSPVVRAATSPAAPVDRSPVPYVLVGLCSVIGSLALVAARRRRHINRRFEPARRPVVPRPLARAARAARAELEESNGALR